MRATSHPLACACSRVRCGRPSAALFALRRMERKHHRREQAGIKQRRIRIMHPWQLCSAIPFACAKCAAAAAAAAAAVRPPRRNRRMSWSATFLPMRCCVEWS